MGVAETLRPLLLLGLLLPLLLVGMLDQLVQTPLPQPLWRITEVERGIREPGAPAAQLPQRWEPVHLPDSAPWDSTAAHQHWWYRLRFELPADGPELWGILLRRPLAAVAIQVNGQLLADSGVARDALPEYQHDLRYNLSRALLREGENEFLFHSVAATWHAGLGEIWLGDSRQLAAFKAARNRVEKHFPGWALQVIVGLAVILGGVFLVRRQEVAFGWFAAALLLWALHTHMTLRQTALFGAPGLSRPIAAVSLGWFVVFGMYFIHRLLGRCEPRRERLAASAVGAGSVLVLLPSLANQPRLFERLTESVFIPLVLLVAASVAKVLVRELRHEPRRAEARWLLLLSMLLIGIGLRDWHYDLGAVGGPHSMRYLPFAAPLVFLVFGTMLLRRHAQALGTAEAANRVLVETVSQKTHEVEQTWQHITAIERERARYEERDRLMREMHDGVGGHLVQALALSSGDAATEPVREAVQSALDDLRLLIDASDVHVEHLNDVLARFRERISRRLVALGIQLDWDFTRMPELPVRSPEHSVQLLRILQELITNIIKHARASRIGIECVVVPDHHGGRARLLLEVRDNGAGLAAAGLPGRGLVSLQQRARALGGSLDLNSHPDGGTIARLLVPLPAMSA